MLAPDFADLAAVIMLIALTLCFVWEVSQEIKSSIS